MVKKKLSYLNYTLRQFTKHSQFDIIKTDTDHINHYLNDSDLPQIIALLVKYYKELKKDANGN